MKISSIKVNEIYTFKNVDSLNDLCNGEKIIVKKIINDDEILVDFIDYKLPVLKDYSTGEINYYPLLNRVISPKEIRKIKKK